MNKELNELKISFNNLVESAVRLNKLYEKKCKRELELREENKRLNNIIKKIVLSCYNSDMTLGEFKEIWHIAFNEEYIIGNLEKLKELKGEDKE